MSSERSTGGEEFIPAAGSAAFTGLYDTIIAFTAREGRMRSGMIRAIGESLRGLESPKILEIGCGTGSLSIAIANALPGAAVTGIDLDERALAIARAKPGAEQVDWRLGSATAPPATDAGWNAVAISLVMHHLSPEKQPQALAAARAVLAPGGVLHVLDFAIPRGLLPSFGFPHLLQRADGVRNTAPIGRGELPRMIETAGFTKPQLIQRFGTIWGTHEQFAATPAT